MATAQQKKLLQSLMSRWDVMSDEVAELFLMIFVGGNKAPEILKEYEKAQYKEYLIIKAITQALDKAYPGKKPDIKAEIMGLC